ncbi:hypothetical protein [Promicromonospora iranensis]|uniref:Uncharacterized protein n=1 Tax=Promicromonospora iranensis TaxID=1105144 RepID=A0ABU2CST7_9MICO|nr:hypothetical protein [Promicromonospora iranensis]MDR7384400.1 hypothetical protein [Promicromonospora iranensis]
MTLPESVPYDIDLDSLFRVPKGKMLHARECQHLTEKSLAVLEPATELDVAKFPICSSCRDALSTGGRELFSSFDVALEALPVPVEHRPRMRKIVSGLHRVRIWIPASRSYIAVSPGAGVSASAYFNKGFVDVHQEDGGYKREWMPGHASSGTSSKVSQAPEPLVCPIHSVQLPATGICDDCE